MGTEGLDLGEITLDMGVPDANLGLTVPDV